MMKPVPAIYAFALLALTTPATAASFSVYDEHLYEVEGLGFRAKEDCTILPTPVRAWSNAHRYTAPAQILCADVAWLGGKWGVDAPGDVAEDDDADLIATPAGAMPSVASVAASVAPAPAVIVPAPQRGSYANLPPLPFDLSGPRQIVRIERFMEPPEYAPDPAPDDTPPAPSPVPLPGGALLLIGALIGLRIVGGRAVV